jgi:hypothetical protein
MAVKPRIESEQLNAIYARWLKSCGVDPRWSDNIDRVNLRYNPGKGFDEFVWKHGGHLGKQHGKRYAEFFDDNDMLIFSLKYL